MSAHTHHMWWGGERLGMGSTSQKKKKKQNFHSIMPEEKMFTCSSIPKDFNLSVTLKRLTDRRTDRQTDGTNTHLLIRKKKKKLKKKHEKKKEKKKKKKMFSPECNTHDHRLELLGVSLTGCCSTDPALSGAATPAAGLVLTLLESCAASGTTYAFA